MVCFTGNDYHKKMLPVYTANMKKTVVTVCTPMCQNITTIANDAINVYLVTMVHVIVWYVLNV